MSTQIPLNLKRKKCWQQCDEVAHEYHESKMPGMFFETQCIYMFAVGLLESAHAVASLVLALN